MDDSPATYADWKAPAEDGAVVIWPDGPHLLEQARSNHALLASADHVRIQNEPLPALRTAQRAWLGHRDDEQLLFATGHQTELLHPGVWIKNALIDEAAKASGGAAYHFAVDTDQPKHLGLRWPGANVPLSDDAAMASADWSGLLAPPTPAHLAGIARRFDIDAGDWPFSPLMGEFLRSMRRLSMEAETLDAALVNAIHEIDWKLGLRHHAMIVSPIFHAEPYLALVHHVLARSCAFAADYNAALAAYRAENGITNPGRPMPDLQQDAGGCEVPFWLDDLSSRSRTRAQVRRHGGVMVLHHGEEDFALDDARPAADASAALLRWLRRHNLRLSPRALMLTTFLRLFVTDQFVHGIGGGRYDQVTDRLIASHFGLTPPRFAVTTATLFFPTAEQEQRVCLPCLQQEGHRLKHAILGETKREMVAAIAAAPRKSLERSLQYAAMHRALTAASRSEPLLAWERRLAEAKQRDDRQQQVFDRELFYAIQPTERLETLVQLCREAFA